jgi:hypothetical protein
MGDSRAIPRTTLKLQNIKRLIQGKRIGGLKQTRSQN